METFAYSAASLSRHVRRVAGASPTLSPPTTMATFDTRELEGRDFLFFKLHGLEDERYWYGDHFTTALSASQLANAHLEGAVVFVANCWLCNERGLPSPMLIALARANARAIIGGAGANYALPGRLGGADLLALYVRVFLQVGFHAHNALRFAKARLRFCRQNRVTEDTLAFRLWRNQELTPTLANLPNPSQGSHPRPPTIPNPKSAESVESAVKPSSIASPKRSREINPTRRPTCPS